MSSTVMCRRDDGDHCLHLGHTLLHPRPTLPPLTLTSLCTCLCCPCCLSCCQLADLLPRLNGFLIPGGAANLRPGHDFFDTAGRVLDFAIKCVH